MRKILISAAIAFSILGLAACSDTPSGPVAVPHRRDASSSLSVQVTGDAGLCGTTTGYWSAYVSGGTADTYQWRFRREAAPDTVGRIIGGSSPDLSLRVYDFEPSFYLRVTVTSGSVSATSPWFYVNHTQYCLSPY